MSTTILIVEDQEEMRRILQLNFEAQGFAVLLAVDGNHGLLQARTHQPDVVVLDVMLPELNGLQVCRAIKSDVATQHASVILMTGRTDDDMRLQSLQSGADAFIGKPFSMDVLVQCIRKCIEQGAASA